MRRKNKRVAKISVNQASSVSGESDATTNFTNGESESLETANSQLNDEIDNKADSDLSQIESNITKSDKNEDGETLIKQEPISADSSFLFVELKLISIDYKCIDYSQLMQKFLCINSNASVEHIKKYIAKNMNILDDLFEVCIWFK